MLQVCCLHASPKKGLYIFCGLFVLPGGTEHSLTLNLEQVMSVKRKGKSKVTIFHDWCKGCGICVAFCPSKVMVIGDQGKAVVVQEEECVYCGFCELHCPDFAIMVKLKDGQEIDEPKASSKIPASEKEEVVTVESVSADDNEQVKGKEEGI